MKNKSTTPNLDALKCIVIILAVIKLCAIFMTVDPGSGFTASITLILCVIFWFWNPKPKSEEKSSHN